MIYIYIHFKAAVWGCFRDHCSVANGDPLLLSARAVADYGDPSVLSLECWARSHVKGVKVLKSKLQRLYVAKWLFMALRTFGDKDCTHEHSDQTCKSVSVSQVLAL